MDDNDLSEALRNVQQEIAEWRRSAGEDFFDGDQGYQRLLEKEASLMELMTRPDPVTLSGRRVWVKRISLGYEGDPPDLIGDATIMGEPNNGQIWVQLDEGVDGNPFDRVHKVYLHEIDGVKS